MPRIVVPDPSLVVLVGPAGAGKSTLAGRAFAAAEILSSDAYRALVAGDPADQRATRAAFARLERDLRGRLRRGLLTVVDATSLERGARRQLLGAAADAGQPAVAVILDLPPEVVLARNRARPRRVPEPVVRDHLRRLRQLVEAGGPAGEGFERVYRLRSPRQLDAVEVVRLPSRRR